MPDTQRKTRYRVAVLWIDWYPYHVARFRGLQASFGEEVVGVEFVGGVGVHQGLKFREDLPADLRIDTLMPGASWASASKLTLAGLVWRKLKELQPEVVLVPGYYTLPALAAAVWARVHGRTSVLMTESTAADHPRSEWRELPKRLALKALFDWAVCGGKAHVRYLRQLHFPADRIVGSYDVVDNALFHNGAAELRQDPASALFPGPYFLYVGRLAPEKNVAGLLQAWIAYRQHEGRWPLVLCGDGPERRSLEALARASQWGQDVHFAGLRSSRELLPIYAHAGCFVLPSTREPWGLVVNEAMAAELPVLVSERCGCGEDLVQPGINGFLFEPTDEMKLEELLHTLDKMAPENRQRMGRHSGEIVAHYSPEGFGRSVAAILAARSGSTASSFAAEGGV